jgi:hypothetical protein
MSALRFSVLPALVAASILFFTSPVVAIGQARGPRRPDGRTASIPGKGPRDFDAMWSPAAPQLYADWKFPADVFPPDTIVEATKDNGRLYEKIDDLLQPWAVAERREHVRLNDIEGIFQLTPESSCRPYTMPGEFQESVFAFQFTLTPRVLVMQRWGEGVIRLIHIDAAHPEPLKPSWMGHSVGRWDGDTLVVDTVGFNDQGKLYPGVPHTEKLHMSATYRLIKDGSLMEIIYTYDDPGSVLRPFKFARILQRGVARQGQESICGENNKELEGIYNQ